MIKWRRRSALPQPVDMEAHSAVRQPFGVGETSRRRSNRPPSPSSPVSAGASPRPTTYRRTSGRHRGDQVRRSTDKSVGGPNGPIGPSAPFAPFEPRAPFARFCARRRRQQARGEAAPGSSVAADVDDRPCAAWNSPSYGREATLGRQIATKTASNGSDNCDNEMLFSVLEAAHYNILPLGGRASEPRWAGPGGWCCCPAAARLAGMARIGSFAPLGLLGFVALPRSAGTCRLAGCSPLLPATPPETPAIIIY